MTFQILAYVTCGAACLLGFRFLFAGGGVLREWGLEPTAGALILFRRLGVIYLGLALAFFLGRNAAPSDFRSAMCLVVAGAVALLACLGLFEFLARRASAGIFRSIAGEAVLSAAFLWLWWAGP
ncbi:hypothetical protein [Sphingosinithalassobacter portus]|uniref:hypothetical protein n=1 Tax=Stakelama portus TaxID=2676234 RepID=UPI000D6EA2CD|nr:hypothetical protein [Sphingosinithalassobacter portus]